ncbi:MAG: WG repeat-containing protein [Clostridia bacterium]|nr:WG repeat-containing protein [Clostridia bacterium]
MSRGKRYDDEPKLNMKKVFAVVIAIVAIIMSIFVIQGIISKDNTKGKISSESYFTIYKNEKYGVINSNGDVIVDPAYKELIIIPNNKKDVFICTYDVDYDSGVYKTKALNSKNEEIFTEYSNIEALANNDINNNIWYEDNCLKVQKDGKYGLINLDGKVLLEPQYEDIAALDGVKNSLKIKKDGKIGIADKDGKIIIEPKYLDITNLGKDNKSGFIVKDQNEKYGVIDYSANKVLESKYNSVEKISGDNLYVVKEDGKTKVIKQDGTDYITEGFDKIKTILSSAKDGVIFSKDGKYGVMKENNEIVIEPVYEDLIKAQNTTLIAKKDGKYGVIDFSRNQKILFDYTSIKYDEVADIFITENSSYINTIINSVYETKLSGILIKIDTEKGYMKLRVGDEYKYFNFKFEEKPVTDILVSNTLFLSKKDGKYGFVDKNGKVVVDYIYDDATDQNSSGFCAVKKDGKWGSIDIKGKVIQEPTYNLDDYLEVDFVGKWHLGKDINMNCYNQE